MNKHLISCPQCETNGKREILGEIDAQGHLSVMRFHTGKTVIVSSNYSVACGKCGQIVFNKLKTIEGTVNIWI